MPAEKYSRTYLEERFPAELREHLRDDNLPPTRLPSYDYLTAKGFQTRGLSKAIKRHFGTTETLSSFLRKQGFGVGDGGDWPTSHAETIKMLNGFRDSRRDRNDDASTTLDTVKSAMRWALQATQELHGTDNLLAYARYSDETEKFQRNSEIEEVLDNLKAEQSGGAADTYSRYLKDFYSYSSVHTSIDYNPIKEVEQQYDFDTTASSDSQPVTDEQVTAIWETLKQLPERRELTDTVANLVDRHGMTDWQVQVMALVVFGVGVGPRSIEYVRTDCQTDWHLDEDPYISFPVRKNRPGEVPVLAHPEFLDAYREYMDRTRADWNGKMFPSSNAESGARAPSTMNTWLKAICEEADVRLPDGTYPTLQNLRQRWMNSYLEALRQMDVQIQLVADEAGTENEEHVRASYQSSEEERKRIRSSVRDGFEKPLKLEELPDGMYDVIEKGEFIGTQLAFSDF